MPIPRALLTDFRSDLQKILDDRYAERNLNGVVRVSHALAISFLKSKAASHKLNPEFLHLNLHDAAYDCIADLFVRDDQNAVVQLKGYFGSLGVDQLSDEALLAHLRRLICSKVNQSIFRLYNEIDPALGKILRNIKLAILALRNFDESEWMGETIITPVTCDSLSGREDIPPDVLEAELRKDLSGRERIPELMSKLALILRRQNEYSRSVPLMLVARVFRSIYSEPMQAVAVGPTAELNLLKEDAATLIRHACGSIQREMLPRYVGKKKVSETTYGHYFAVIEQRLLSMVVSEDGVDFSYYQELRKHMPGLTREHYAKAHRATLEYLGRMVEERFRSRIKSG